MYAYVYNFLISTYWLSYHFFYFYWSTYQIPSASQVPLALSPPLYKICERRINKYINNQCCYGEVYCQQASALVVSLPIS